MRVIVEIDNIISTCAQTQLVKIAKAREVFNNYVSLN
jgi:hypothetical protein